VKNPVRIGLQLLFATTDAGAILFATWLSYSFRFSEIFTRYVPVVTSLPPAIWYMWLSLIIAALTIVLLSSGGLYKFPRQDGYFDEMVKTTKCFLTAFLLLLAILFFYRNASFSRVTIIFLLVSSGVSLFITRSLGRKIRKWIYMRGIAIRRAAIIGGGKGALSIIEQINTKPQFGITIIGCLGNNGHSDKNSIPIIGKLSDAPNVISENNIDTLIAASEQDDPSTLPELIKTCYGLNVDFLYMPDVQAIGTRPRRIVEVGGTPLWTLKENPFDGMTGLFKRTFDIVFSTFFLLIASPVMITLIVLIKLSSKGHLLYRQPRIGLSGMEFDCLKFRSMRVDAESQSGPVWATKNDTRVTSVGKFMRRWSLDELPQLWNVLRGDMSLVGPRPERPEFVRQFEKEIDGYHERHRVRAGLTGWAQVNGLRGDTPITDRTIFDRFYVENWSLTFDLKIILLTLQAVVKGENAY